MYIFIVIYIHISLHSYLATHGKHISITVVIISIMRVYHFFCCDYISCLSQLLLMSPIFDISIFVFGWLYRLHQRLGW